MEVIHIVVLILLLMIFMDRCKARDGFSLSKKPMETEWNLLNHNPFDNIDYDTPTFTKM
jgi:hypothetical protein